MQTIYKSGVFQIHSVSVDKSGTAHRGRRALEPV